MTTQERIDLLHVLNFLLGTYKANNIESSDIEAKIKEIVKTL